MIEARQKAMQLYPFSSAYRFSDHNGRFASPVADRIQASPESPSSAASGNNAFARLTAVANIRSSCFGYRGPTPSPSNTCDAEALPAPHARSMRYASTSSVPTDVSGRENAGRSAWVLPQQRHRTRRILMRSLK